MAVCRFALCHVTQLLYGIVAQLHSSVHHNNAVQFYTSPQIDQGLDTVSTRHQAFRGPSFLQGTRRNFNWCNCNNYYAICYPLLSDCVCFFHLSTGTNFSSSPLLFSCALEGGSITWDQSTETPLRFISFAHNLGVNHRPAFPDCQRALCLCAWRQADIIAFGAVTS